MASFTVDISQFVAKAQGRMDLVVRKVALEMFTRIVMRSPVDTGRFRGNWLVQVGSVPTGTTNKKSPTGAQAIADGSSALAGTKAGTTIFMANNLPYARRLEYGYSKQAPNGMVRITAAEFGRVVERSAAEAKREMP